MKKLLLLFAFLTIQTIFGQCPEGDLRIFSQAELDDYLENYPNCTEINGSLMLYGSENLTDLEALKKIVKIRDNISIQNLAATTNIDGLNNIKIIGGGIELASNEINPAFLGLERIEGNLNLRYNQISSLIGFDDLIFVGGNLHISYNTYETVDAFENLTIINGSINIDNNDNLEKLSGFNSLVQSDNNLLIESNFKLNSIEGFESLKLLGGSFIIEDCPSLIKFQGFQSLTRVNGNINLKDLNISEINLFNSLSELDGSLYLERNKFEKIQGFENIKTLRGGISIQNNENLLEISGLSNLKSMEGSLSVAQNRNLKKISGFRSLDLISGDVLFGSNVITDFDGLNNLSMVNGRFDLLSNSAEIENIDNLSGFDNLQKIVGGLYIGGCNALKLSAFKNLEEVGQLGVNSNTFNTISGLNNLSKIGGNLSITNNPNLRDLNFDNLEIINRNLNLVNNGLIDINGLNNLISIGDMLSITTNPKLATINGFQNLKEVEVQIYVYFNRSLERVGGFSSLESINQDHGNAGIFFSNNYNIKIMDGFNSLVNLNSNLTIGSVEGIDYSGFKNLESVYQFSFGGTLLKDMTDFESLKSVRELNIGYCPELKSLEGLENIKSSIKWISIVGNNKLQDISALKSISSISENLEIRLNKALSTCSILPVCDYLSEGGHAIIGKNNDGCNDVSQIENACADLSAEVPNDKKPISFYPNPVKNIVTLTNLSPESQTIEIVNIYGNIVRRKEITGEVAYIDVTDLSSGIYFIVTKKNEKKFFYKFLKS